MRYDAVVVGLGGMGSASLAQLAKRGLRVLGIERYAEGHGFGASSGRSRLIRKAYFEDPAYVPLLVRAYELWRELERASGAEILRLTGVLIAGFPGSAAVEGTRGAARLHGLPVDELDARDLRTRFPVFAPREDEIAVYESDAGVLAPERAVAALLGVARAAGAQARFETRVQRWDDVRDHVRVALDDGETIEASRLVITTGPWLAELAPQTGAAITLQRNVPIWFKPERSGFDAAVCPVSLVDRKEFPKALYVFPDLGDGVKAGFHTHGDVTQPDNLAREIIPSDIEPVREATNAWMPGAAGAFLDGKACMYALTPDEHFALGIHSDAPRVVIAGGFSGHGFKFTPVIGEIVADLLVDAATPYDITFLSLGRENLKPYAK